MIHSMLFTPMLLVAELQVNAPWKDVLFFMLIGFILVMVVLAILSSVIAVQGALFSRFQKKTPPAPVISPAASAPAAPSDTLEPHLLAILAAAVDSVLDQPHRILSIQPASAMQNWSVEGRRQIFASHKVR